jgi:hypothetical protein
MLEIDVILFQLEQLATQSPVKMANLIRAAVWDITYLKSQLACF